MVYSEKKMTMQVYPHHDCIITRPCVLLMKNTLCYVYKHLLKNINKQTLVLVVANKARNALVKVVPEYSFRGGGREDAQQKTYFTDMVVL